MPRVVCRVGTQPKTFSFSDCRLERRGFLSVFSFKEGRRSRRTEIMERGQAVAILPVDFSRRVLYLVEQPRPAKTFVQAASGRDAVKAIMDGRPAADFAVDPADILTLELPAGMIDGDERPLQAAIRELREETGFEVPEANLMPANRFFATLGCCTETITGFIARVDGLPEPDVACGDGEETISVWEYAWDEAFAAARGNRFDSATTLVLLQRFEIELLAGKWPEMVAGSKN